MNYKQLKNILDAMTEEELKRDVIISLFATGQKFYVDQSKSFYSSKYQLNLTIHHAVNVKGKL